MRIKPKTKLFLVKKGTSVPVHRKTPSPKVERFKMLGASILRSSFTLSLVAYILGMSIRSAMYANGHSGLFSLVGSVTLVAITIVWEVMKE